MNESSQNRTYLRLLRVALRPAGGVGQGENDGRPGAVVAHCRKHLVLKIKQKKYQALKQLSDFAQIIQTCENSTDAGEPDEDIRLDLLYDVLEAHALPIVLLGGKVGEVVE